MSWNDLYRTDRNDPQNGSTVVELVVALSIIAVLVGAVWAALSNGFFRTEESRSRGREITELALVDLAVRDAVGRVRPPLWLPDAPIVLRSSRSGGLVELRYIDGVTEKAIRISSEEGAVVFAGPEDERRAYEGIEIVEMEAVEDTSGTPIGIRFELGVVDGDTRLATVAAFGAVVLEAQ